MLQSHNPPPHNGQFLPKKKKTMQNEKNPKKILIDAPPHAQSQPITVTKLSRSLHTTPPPLPYKRGSPQNPSPTFT